MYMHSDLIDMSLRREHGQIIGIMPKDMFAMEFIVQAVELAAGAVGKFSYDSSLTVQWGIRTCPPKPDLRKLSEAQRSAVNTQSAFMNRFSPVKLHDYNIGSNAGLSRSMRELFSKVMSAPYDTSYHAVLADVSIFERMLKVSLAPSSSNS